MSLCNELNISVLNTGITLLSEAFCVYDQNKFKNNYTGHTPTCLSRRLILYLSELSSITIQLNTWNLPNYPQHMTIIASCTC